MCVLLESGDWGSDGESSFSSLGVRHLRSNPSPATSWLGELGKVTYLNLSFLNVGDNVNHGGVNELIRAKGPFGPQSILQM